MRVGIVLEDDTGVHGHVCEHFGQSKYFFLLDVDKDSKRIIGSRTVSNPVAHGGGGCGAVDEILKYRITHLIAGGMGMGAQQKFADAGVEVFGYSGSVKKAIDDFLNNEIGSLDACRLHGEDGACG